MNMEGFALVNRNLKLNANPNLNVHFNLKLNSVSQLEPANRKYDVEKLLDSN